MGKDVPAAWIGKGGEEREGAAVKAAVKVAADFPTKEEIRAARAVMRKVRAARLKKYRGRRRRPLAADFYTWTHDVRILLQSSARDVSISPIEAARRAASVADSMAMIIAERRPADGPKSRPRSKSAEIMWGLWQEMFDSMIHEMAARSELLPHVIVDRARRIADAAMPHLKRRARR